jgi:hypothetical protein
VVRACCWPKPQRSRSLIFSPSTRASGLRMAVNALYAAPSAGALRTAPASDDAEPQLLGAPFIRCRPGGSCPSRPDVKVMAAARLSGRSSPRSRLSDAAFTTQRPQNASAPCIASPPLNASLLTSAVAAHGQIPLESARHHPIYVPLFAISSLGGFQTFTGPDFMHRSKSVPRSAKRQQGRRPHSQRSACRGRVREMPLRRSVAATEGGDFVSRND